MQRCLVLMGVFVVAMAKLLNGLGIEQGVQMLARGCRAVGGQLEGRQQKNVAAGYAVAQGGSSSSVT